MERLTVDRLTAFKRELRRSVVDEWARTADGMQVALPLILELLRRDETARVMIAEAFGTLVDAERSMESTYDDLIKQAIVNLEATPAGKCAIP